MFWGAHIKKGTSYKLDEHTESSLLHVSNIALGSTPESISESYSTLFIIYY